MKKPIYTLLALFACAFLPLYAADLSDLTYTTTDGEVTITDCNQAATGELIIPDSIEGNPVTKIGNGAFEGCASLTSITIPDSITSFGDSTFANCKSLTSITIPNGVTSIMSGVFYHCSSLTAVTFLGDAPKIIAPDAFGPFPPTTIYRNPEAKGWGDTFGGRPVKLISEKP